MKEPIAKITAKNTKETVNPATECGTSFDVSSGLFSNSFIMFPPIDKQAWRIMVERIYVISIFFTFIISIIP